MAWAFAGLIAVGLIPLVLALWANRRTSLAHALVWAIIAWASWAVAMLFDDRGTTEIPLARYCALCLTGCAGVAVLGARRPHVLAWNFVVLGLLAIMAWPMLETLVLGTGWFDGLRRFFLATTIAIGVLNFVPTRLLPTAALLFLACALEVWRWIGKNNLAYPFLAPLIGMQLAALPWLGWFFWRKWRRDCSAFDRLWFEFRDRWGMMWSQRAREQFNHAAENAGWPVRLRWSGLARCKNGAAPSAADEEKYLSVLRAVLQRFLAD
jgi:hypothetical protein